MVINRKPLVAIATAGLMVSLAACGGGSGSSNNDATAGKKGGTLRWLTFHTNDHMDPQRTYVGVNISNLNRLTYRGLVSYPITKDLKKGTTPVPDLATDTGTSSNGAKTWKFTLKDGVKWQDGKPVTCEDLKYGASRTFATDVITGGPNYALSYPAAPHGKDGLPLYDGPNKNDHKADFDKAITCSGKTITYNSNKPF